MIEGNKRWQVFSSFASVISFSATVCKGSFPIVETDRCSTIGYVGGLGRKRCGDMEDAKVSFESRSRNAYLTCCNPGFSSCVHPTG